MRVLNLTLRRSFYVLTIFCVGAGCYTASSDGDDTAPTQAVSEQADEVPDEEWSEGLPVDEQTRWLLDLFNERQGKISREEMDERFGQEVHRAITYQHFAREISVIANGAPFTVESVQSRRDRNSLVLVVAGADGREHYLVVTVEPMYPHKMRGIHFNPVPRQDDDLPSSWEEIDADLTRVGEHQHLLAARIVDGECEPIHEVDSHRVFPIVDAVQLYVLAALANAVADGLVNYDDPITIEAQHLILPRDDEPVLGSEYMVAEVALQMITHNDQTAMDHLIALIGRERIEEQLREFGHHDPELLQPFLFTAEYLKLKLALTDGQRQDYLTLSLDEQRQFLVDELADVDLPTVEDADRWSEPRDVDTVQYLGTAADMCRLHAHFVENAQVPAYAHALAITGVHNGGLEVDADFIGFKEGSEPGAFHFSWLIRTDDGDWYSLTLGAYAPEEQINGIALHDIARSAVNLMLE